MSDVVATVSVLDVETFEGFVTPTSWMLTPWPAAIDWPLLSAQVRVGLLLEKQNPTFVAVVVSVTVVLVIALSTVPAGNLVVNWLLAVADIAPDEESVKPIV